MSAPQVALRGISSSFEEFSLAAFLGAPQRFCQFLAATARTSFFPAEVDATESEEVGTGDGRITQTRRCRQPQPSILIAVFPPAFFKYAISTAVTDVLRYSLLASSIGVPKSSLPSVVGAVDASCAVMDVLVRLDGSWDACKSRLVGIPSGPMIAAAFYTVGVAVISVGAINAACDDDSFGDDNDEKRLVAMSCAASSYFALNYYERLVLFASGSFVMRLGHGLLWNIWTQSIKHQAEEGLKVATHATFNIEHSIETSGLIPAIDSNIMQSFDIQGKISQIQVLLRYGASFLAPLWAAFTLSHMGDSPVAAYFIMGGCFVVLCTTMAYLVGRLDDELRGAQTTQTVSDPLEIHTVRWSEMLPRWYTSWLCRRGGLQFLASEDTTAALTVSDDTVGRFSAAFFHLGAFSSLTEVVRGGYTRVVCLRAITSNLSHGELAHILSVVGLTALCSFWMADLADRNRQMAASLGFALLGVGHFGLACSSDMGGFFATAVVFGLGEGCSTGLRALIKQDYLHECGPLRETTGRNAAGRRLRRQFCNKTAIWTDVTLVLNSVVVGVIGQYLGMRVASLVFGALSVYAVYFSSVVLPDTKPRSTL